MATRKHRGIPLSSLNPKFLHTNSTSHTWPFSAIAELIDNAYDPDVRAKQFWIDWTRIKNLDCLSFMDNGAGMTRAKLHKMLSFGYSDKKAMRDHVPVGVYGNGFKSGSMRVGKDAIVFTKTRDSMSVGLLSQSYLQAIKAQQILVPILTFRRDGKNIPEDAASLDAILRHSLFNTEKELFTELRAISIAGPTGSRIIIWNLRRTTNGETEFNFDADKYDIQIRANASDKTRESRAMTPESDYSLRAYCSILYLKPRMQINIRGQKVKTQLISKSLAYIAIDNYRPSFLTKRIRITFGFNTKSKEHYGIMMYHKNRLIKAYEKVSCQRKVERKGVGVIGVIECNFLQPTHNKQDFDDTDKYRKTMHNLSIKLEDYWNEIHYMQKKEDPKCTVPIEDTIKVPDQVWVQCDSCLKWRRLPDGFDCSRLPEKWFCNMNHDPQFRSCLVEEELQDQEEEQKSYPKCFKRQKRNSRSLQYEHGPEVFEIPALEAPVNARQLKNPANWKSSPADLFSNSVTSLSVLPTTSYAQRSPMPLINLTALSDSSFAANKEEGKWDEMENESNANTDNKESFKTARCNPYQEPFQKEDDEWYASEESTSTETQYCTAESHTMEEEEEELCDNNQDEWSLPQQQDELVEMMEQTAEDKEVCTNELELLRNHCTALEDERSQLLSKLEKMEEQKASLSSMCDQLKCKMERLKAEKDGRLRENVRNREERQKLRKLRINLGHLLVSFVPDLDLQQVDFNTDVIDELLDQVLKEVT
ncbi:MORC family CW-type zinc finger protein 3b isoform X2 [Tachysurus fulvidraco]|uniref:MORC family CW-type zinc finger protein 3b isoform X2 n=1 Tax=Tachysurus fulvidraco TaxID=1234273 RepID=UPI001FEF798C|nr:MORC family CW-type zinc finger protein 3b isoform X2 [Tachysurus fulvidraco]